MLVRRRCRSRQIPHTYQEAVLPLEPLALTGSNADPVRLRTLAWFYLDDGILVEIYLF